MTTISTLERRIECDKPPHHRLLLRVTSAGISVLCKQCRRVHLVTWERLDAVRREVVEYEARREQGA